ncbi:Uncharacterized protein LOCC1_G002627 [Lachnellula occidentalis]|uniref:Flavin reductase like domain-containing protein n=1 Tax=Lachnellula occidentalis TaxID=215460 RepID=A0A8H8UH48_9HELO|nr:Uncharacterized protein LOCC1_G002627 [Lachnellula occidentalis]
MRKALSIRSIPSKSAKKPTTHGSQARMTSTKSPFELKPKYADFRKVQASRPDFDPNLPITYTKNPDPDWKYGKGSSDTSSREKSHIEIDPYEDGRPMISNYKLLVSGVPRPISFVSTVSKDGTRNLAPFSYFQVVDHDPPIFVIGFSGRAGRPKDTIRNLVETGECVISVVSEHMIEAVNATSLDIPFGKSEWELSGMHAAPSSTVKAERVKEAIFSVEGKLLEMKDMNYGHAKLGKPFGSLAIIQATRFWVREDAMGENGEEIDLSVMRPLYCSKACQEDDWKRHKADCKKSAIKYEKLYADFVLLEPAVKGMYGGWNNHDGLIYLTNMEHWPMHHYNERVFKVLWSTTPARDILNLAKNEGMNYQKNLDLCFTTAADLRSVMTTVNGLPSNYEARCSMIVNDADELLTFRNILILILALENQEGMFTDAIVHLWYSASLTLACYAQITMASLKIKDLFHGLLVDCPETEAATHPYSIPGAKSRMYITLSLEQLKMFFELFALGRSMELCEKNRRFSMGEDCDPQDTGILRPYGASVTGFTKPNRTFYATNQNWISGYLPRPTDSVDLLRLAKFANAHGLPKNDINGALYHFTTSMVNKFCDRLKTHDLVFSLGSQYASSLPENIEGRNAQKNDSQKVWGFDRIELGTNMIEGVLNTEFIFSFTPILRTSAENPHATISLIVPTEQFRSEDSIPRRAAQNMLPWRSICFKAHMTEQKLMQERIRKVQDMIDKADLNWDNISNAKGVGRVMNYNHKEGTLTVPTFSKSHLD